MTALLDRLALRPLESHQAPCPAIKTTTVIFLPSPPSAGVSQEGPPGRAQEGWLINQEVLQGKGEEAPLKGNWANAMP